jgi:hypothetical protein
MFISKEKKWNMCMMWENSPGISSYLRAVDLSAMKNCVVIYCEIYTEKFKQIPNYFKIIVYEVW